ncbi:uncharacterized protein METZ01_LOCUS440923 [marine metagenome]|uniref:Uncharacterized protein n=1 Tax=marine metagenome TaxID=408172 RepID=A0A382YYP5_9ZZZZ
MIQTVYLILGVVYAKYVTVMKIETFYFILIFNDDFI